MRWTRFLRPHSRWREQVDAYLDEELPGAARARFGGHLAACIDCTAELEARRSLKQLLSAVPEMPAPRSFRLTPAMAAAPAKAPAAPRLALRAAQFGAAAASIALVTVLFIDVGGSGGSGGDTTAASLAADDAGAGAGGVAERSTNAQSQPLAPSSDGTPAAAGGAPVVATPTPGLASPSRPPVGAQSTASVAAVPGDGTATQSATPPAPRTGSDSPVPPSTGAVTPIAPGTSAGSSASPGGGATKDTATAEAFAANEDRDGTSLAAPGVAPEGASSGEAGDDYLALEVALGAVALMALGSALFLHRRLRNQ